MRLFTSVGGTCARSVMLLVTPVTPVSGRTVFSQVLRWYSQSTSPVMLTQPFSTFTRMRSAGMNTCQRNADSMAVAISASLRLWSGASFTSSSTATALTPCTRCTARSMAYFSA